MARKAKSNANTLKKDVGRSQNILILVFYYIGHPIFRLLTLPIDLISKLQKPRRGRPRKHTLINILGYLNIFHIKPKIRVKTKKKESKKVTFSFKLSRKLLFSFLTSFAILFSFLFAFYFVFIELPSAKELVNRKIELTTKIYDRNGVLLYSIFKDKNRSLIKLDEIPKNLKLATLAAEDSEFYKHPGFSLKGIARALLKNWKEDKTTGGSTITQQLVKNAFLSPEKTITRKVKEIILALKVETTFSKDEILEMYLNEVSYGGSAYGVAQASEVYFGKKVSELNLAESALLAGLPQRPSKFSPFGTYPDMTFERQREVLRLMHENGYITEEEEKEARNTKITFSKKGISIKAPHFVMYVKELLEEKYGKEMVETGGLEVVTTLDYNVQTEAEKIIREEIAKLKGMNVTNGAAVVINPQTGEILAMVGSKDYFDITNGGNFNVTTGLRQPGSSIKVVNYAYALSNGYTSASILSDTPTTFKSKYSEDYSPQNYDGKYKGNITLRKAFAESRNLPAVKLLNSYGVKKMVEFGKKLGITTWDNDSRFGLSLTLGGGETKLTEMAGVYATFANSGKKPIISSILQVTNANHKELEKNTCSSVFGTNNKLFNFEVSAAFNNKVVQKCKQEQVVDPRVAFIVTDILKDNEARSGSFGINSQLVIKNHPEVAVKTGTSNSLRDNLAIGYNQNYLAAIWVGNNNNTPMSRVASGVTGASPIFNRIMTYLLKDTLSTDWSVPDNLVNLPICTYTGTLSCGGCSNKLEWFLEENTPKTKCSNEAVEKIRKELVEKGIKTGEIIERAYSTTN